jgi:Ca2+-binding EF-hand superfamily protein
VEFAKLIAVLGSTLGAEEAMAAIDTNKDGKISLHEMCHWFERPEENV